MGEDFGTFLRERWYIVVAVVGIPCALCLCAIVLWSAFADPFDIFADGDTAELVPVEEPVTIPPEATATAGTAPDKPTPTATTVPTEAPTPTPEPVLSGTYGVVVRAVLGDLSHAFFIALRRWVALSVRQSDITFEGSEPWVTVVGTVEDDGSFSAEGRGTVAGYSDVAVTFEGTIVYDPGLGYYLLSGDYTMGAEGGLPGGQSITYSIEGFRIGALDESVPETEMEDLETFIPVFMAAIQSQDSAFLIERMHPASAAFYGAETCQGYIEGLNDPSFNIEAVEVSGPAHWLWEREGLAADVSQVYTITANLTTGEQTTQSELHFGLVNGLLHWFPDCGDAVP